MNACRCTLLLSLSAWAFVAGLAQVQECSPDDKVPFDFPVNETEIIEQIVEAFFSEGIPDRCQTIAGFRITDCRADLKYKEGCCDPLCQEVASQIPFECLVLLGDLLCDEDPETQEILGTVVSRCTGLPTLSCDMLREEAAKLLPQQNDTSNSEDSGSIEDVQDDEQCPPRETDDFSSATLLPFLDMDLEPPEACAEAVSANATLQTIFDIFIPCESELAVIQGCCSQPCKNALTKANLSVECIEAVLGIVCEIQPESHAVMKRAFERCVEGVNAAPCMVETQVPLQSPENGVLPMVLPSPWRWICMSMLAMALLAAW